ncbi:tyrosine protein phosphatase [candidate division KSB1 bacterium]|nr:tyrosine protein phosphatase [candidate division KSB1 bacterium]
MIDIHTHILPKVDDGAQNIDDSLKMLRQAQDDGIEAVVLTPHILNHSDFNNESEYLARYKTLVKAAEEANIQVDIMLGSEIYVQPELLLDKKMATLNNNGKYFLIEFPMGSIPGFIAERFFTIILDGMIPIIAHPERNLGFLQRPALAYEFVARGALMQINSGSLLGRFGPKVKSLAFDLIEHNLVHFVASDCHDTLKRRCRLKKAYETVAEKWGLSLADDLFINNAKKALIGKQLTLPEPMPITRKPESLLGKLRSMLSSA